jgi:hypothetical protein
MSDPKVLSPLHWRDNGRIIHQISSERATVEQILDFIPELNAHGFRCYGNHVSISNKEHTKLRDALRDPKSIFDLSESKVSQLNGWLSSFKRCSHWRHTSYSLKHRFERETGTYVSDGAFIVCVLMAGFETKMYGPTVLLKMRRPVL